MFLCFTVYYKKHKTASQSMHPILLTKNNAVEILSSSNLSDQCGIIKIIPLASTAQK